ncbi:MAG: efflux RND transporter periplasmic adaptor subunit [Gemmatimonadaceae bacterium]
MRLRTDVRPLVLAFVAIAACSRSDADTPAAAQTPGAPAGARAQRSVTLGAEDVALVRTASVEDGVPITGTLRPIQTIDVRSRLEGDLTAVYVLEGESVRTGQVLAVFESLDQQGGEQSARADQVAAQGELSTAEWNLEQTRELHRVGAVPERDLRAAQQAVTTARARKAAADARLRSMRLGVRDTRVLAPTSASVLTRHVEPGEHVARGAQLFTLVRNDVLELAAAVPERRASSITVGQLVRFDAGGRQFEGRVARFSPTIDPSTRALTVYIRVPNAGGQLKGGTFASGTVVSRTIAGALIVPIPAIRQLASGESFVYKIAGGVVEQPVVTVGVVNENAGVAQVLTGLAAGDRVIVGNVGTIGRGMAVEVIGGDSTAAQAVAPAQPAPRPR